jgi:hypothetical protein
MNHGEGEGGGVPSGPAWLPMIICCAVMIALVVLLGAGLFTLR